MKIITNPRDIEAKSFQIVDKHLTNVKMPRLQKEVVKRVLHATSDLNYVKDLLFSKGAIPVGLEAIRQGKDIIVDAEMVKAGINKKILKCLGGRVVCLINNKDVIRKSSELKITRAILAMKKSAKLIDKAIVGIGNAPTALFEVCNLVENGKTKPALIVGVPIGFVGAKDAKRKLIALKIPYITNRTRKGGSSVACAIINSLLILAKERKIILPLSRM